MRNNIRNFLALGVVLALVGTSARGQLPLSGASTETAVDPARRAAAEEFANAIDLKTQQRMASEVVAQQIESVALRQVMESDPSAQVERKKDPAKFEAKTAALQVLLATELRKLNAELAPQAYSETLNIYARTFTTAELHQIRDFYLSPLGRKLLEKQPQLIQECTALNQRLALQKMPALIEKVRAFIQSQDSTQPTVTK